MSERRGILAAFTSLLKEMARLYNPTDKKQSFRFDGREYLVEPKSYSNSLDPNIVIHYRDHVNGPMVPEDEKAKQTEETNPDYQNMEWLELRAIAMKKPWYQEKKDGKPVGMKMDRQELIKNLTAK